MTQLALVGAGFMGQFHAQAIASSDVAELTAVVDLNPAAREVADRYGARYLPSIDEALAADGIDGFVVALPDRAHVEPACRLLEAGRSVLLEKPMADTLEGAKRIAQAASDGGARLLVGHVLRYDPRYAHAAETVAAGAIGDVLHVSSGRLAGQGLGERMNGTSSVLFYLGVHDADLVQWLSGQSVTRVYSRAVSKVMPSRGVESEDAILTTCELDGGAVAQLYAGWTLRDDTPAPVNARTMVVGSEGAIEIDVRDHGMRIHDRDGYRQPDALHWPEANGRLLGDLLEEVRHFAVAIERDEPFLMSVDEALRAVAVNDAILRSVASGQPEEVEAWAIA
ncbi:MAG TPA: Gfo/Idh/MocA family oxidoreductase [Capillimicrobium sp.]|nr:Gfo/Idh/MocA family oxidoreductase [Capillimicrobium sp.]